MKMKQKVLKVSTLALAMSLAYQVQADELEEHLRNNRAAGQ